LNATPQVPFMTLATFEVLLHTEACQTPDALAKERQDMFAKVLQHSQKGFTKRLLGDASTEQDTLVVVDTFADHHDSLERKSWNMLPFRDKIYYHTVIGWDRAASFLGVPVGGWGAFHASRKVVQVESIGRACANGDTEDSS